jgi:lysophosphatidic acid acyltransferase/lysophosphatidylinositol acyltransferase
MLAKNLTDWTHDLCPPYDSRVIITCSVRSSVVIVPYIFDTTFAFPHGIITLTDVFQGNKVYADVHVRRIPVSDIPLESEEVTSAWMINLFKEKDDLIDYHCQHGRFPGTMMDHPPRLYPTVIMTLWTTLFFTLLLWYVYSLVIAGEFVKFIVLLTLLLGAYFGMRLLMTVSQIPQGHQQPVQKGD